MDNMESLDPNIANADAQPETSPETSDTTPDESSQEPSGTDWEKLLALARKRQAGAEAARRAAEAKAAEALKKLEAYEAERRATAPEKEAGDIANLLNALKEAERRVQEAEAKAEAKILDFKYPAARAKFPEVRDEVRLAELEALLSEDTPPPPPQRHNESKTSNSSPAPKEKSLADLRAELLAMALPEDWRV